MSDHVMSAKVGEKQKHHTKNKIVSYQTPQAPFLVWQVNLLALCAVQLEAILTSFLQ